MEIAMKSAHKRVVLYVKREALGTREIRMKLLSHGGTPKHARRNDFAIL